MRLSLRFILPLAIALAAIAFMACLIPAYRATRMGSVNALRNE